MGRAGFSFLPSLDGRKVPSQLTRFAMPFTKSSDEELDRIASAALALLRTQPDNMVDHPHGHTFLDIERAAREVGRRVATPAAGCDFFPTRPERKLGERSYRPELLLQFQIGRAHV